jgi:hypothetical protein
MNTYDADATFRERYATVIAVAALVIGAGLAIGAVQRALLGLVAAALGGVA